MKKTHDLRLELYDKRVGTLLKKDLDMFGLMWSNSYNEDAGYDYIVIELDSPLLNVALNDLVNTSILYFAMMDVFKDDFKARAEIQKQFIKDGKVVLDEVDALCS